MFRVAFTLSTHLVFPLSQTFSKETPLQTKYNDENVYDCGVFVCLFADFIALDCAPIFDFDEEYINKCRELISLAIMNECAIDYNLND